jgi:mTERF domain-containing protein
MIKVTHFCTQTAAPSTTPLDWGIFREFLLNKCGFTEEDITKAYGNRNGLRRKSMQSLEEDLELLYGCGLTTPAHIRKVVIRNPKFFICKSETKLKTRLYFLRTFMKEDDVCKLIYSYPTIFSVREHRVKSTISLLQKMGVEGEFLSFLLAWQPRLFCASEEKVTESFKQAEDLGVKKGSKPFAAAIRAFLGVGRETIDQRLQCLRSSGFSEKQILEISSKRPLILGCSEENLKHHVDFVVNSLGLSLADLVKHATLFTFSVEKRMIPRYRVLEALKSMKVLRTKMRWLNVFRLSEKHFLEKYVNSNPEFSSVLWDVYHGGKAEKLITDKETCTVSQ